MKSIFSERGLFHLIPKNANPVIALGTAAMMRGWTSVWTGDIKVFVKKNILATTGIIPYIVEVDVDVEIVNGLPITTELQTIADLLAWRDIAKMSRQIPIEVFAVLFESDDPYPREIELEKYLKERELLVQYKQLREECKSFYDY